MSDDFDALDPNTWQGPPPAPSAPSGYFEVQVNGAIFGMLYDAVAARLAEANAQGWLDQTIFRYGNKRIHMLDGQLEVVDQDRLMLSLAHHFDFYKTVGDKARRESIAPPRDLVKLLATSAPWKHTEYGELVIDRILRAPALLPDGRLVATPGYDAGTRSFLALESGLVIPAIPSNPTLEHAQKCLSWLRNWLSDFRFRSLADEVNALSMIMAPILVVLLPDGSSIPLFGVDAPTAGSGKGMLVDFASVIAAGREAPAMPADADNDEYRKRLVVIATQAAPIVHFDNASREINQATLASLLTMRGPLMERVLQTSTSSGLPIRSVFAVSGNNLAFGGDIPRRVVHIRLDTGLEHPEDRNQDEFKRRLLRDAHRDRGLLIASILTIGRYWYLHQDEVDQSRLPTMGSFEAHTQQMGGIFQLLGQGSYLRNSDLFRADNDDDRAQVAYWLSVIRSWQREPWSAPQVTAAYDNVKTIKDAWPRRWRSKDGKPDDRFLGYRLREMVDQPFGGLALRRSGLKHNGQRAWSVEKLGEDQGDGTLGIHPATAEDEKGPKKPSGDDENEISGEDGTRLVTMPPFEAPAAPDQPEAAPPTRGEDAPLTGPTTQDGSSPEPPEKVVILTATDPSSPPILRSNGEDGEDAPPSSTLPRAREESYDLVDSRAQLAVWLPRLKLATRLGFDLETSGLDPFRDTAEIVQLAAPGLPVAIIDVQKLGLAWFQELLADGRQFVVFNGSFDLRWLLQAGLDLHRARFYDPLLVELVLDASGQHFVEGEHRLQPVVERQLGEELPKKEQESDWTQRPLTEEQLAYAARDAAVLLRLQDNQAPRIEGAELERTVELENRTMPGLTQMQHAGVPVDIPMWTARVEADVLRRGELREQLYAATGVPRLELRLRRDGEPLKNQPAHVWDSNPQLKQLLAEHGLDLPNVAESTLREHQAALPWIADLLQYREVAKLVTTYGIRWLTQSVDRTTGRLHSDLAQIGAGTGRMSSSRPNMQNLPRGPRVRAAIHAAAGQVFVDCDYDQLELRLLADLAQDELLIANYNDPDPTKHDVHRLTASLLLGVPFDQVTQEQRQQAKAMNFGLGYGMGVDRFLAHARDGYGVVFTREEATAHRSAWLETYRGVHAWQKQHGDEVTVDTRTRIGRRRLNISKYTEKLASPIQGAGGDAIKAAIALCWERYESKPRSARLILVVHDELLLECDEDEAAESAAWLQGCMVDGLAPMLTSVPAVAAPKVMTAWAK